MKNNNRSVLWLLILMMELIVVNNLQAQDGSIITPPSYSNSANIGGFIRTWSPVKPETDPNNITTGSNVRDFRQITEYLDGLGRTVQTVVKQGSQVTGGSAYDLIQALVYDEYGRETRKYLPFASTSSGGSFQTNPFQQQNAFYSNANSPIAGQGENYFYGKTEYEASPLNRVNKTFAPGNSWVHDGRGLKKHYWNNTLSDSVRIWNVADITGSFGSYTSTRSYPTGTLNKIISVDERNNQVVEYTDNQGKMILKKVKLSALSDTGQGKGHDGWLCTYYIYDAVNRLRAVIQPNAVERMNKAVSWSLTPEEINEQVFQYAYDNRHRLIKKKAPGTGEIWMVYDKCDQLVLTQNPVLRQQNRWMFIKYDMQGRPIMTGFTYVNGNHQEVQDYVHDYSQNSGCYETPENWYPFYSDNCFPIFAEGTSFYNSITWYDNYDWTSHFGTSFGQFDNSFSSIFPTPSNTLWPYPQAMVQSLRTRGNITGQWEDAGSGLVTSFIYDDKGRVIQTKYKNITGGIDITTLQYDFEGKLLQNHVRHQAILGSTKNYEIGTKNNYDNLGRLINTEKQLNGNGWKTISEIEYDALGQVKKKKIGDDPNNTGAPLETLNFAYNIRGWLLGVNRDYAKDELNSANHFGFDLGYDKVSIQASGQSSIGSFNAPAYNGNISGVVWKSRGDGVIRKYDYSHDAVNRLLRADFTQREDGNFTNTNVNFDVKIGDGTDPHSAYDANGNIKRMQQWGLKISGSEKIDDLNYTYYDYSNKLKNVIDAENDTATILGDFRSSKLYMTNLSNNKTASATDYTYDAGGNLVKDLNKDIVTFEGGSGIVYNHRNQPRLITIKKDGASNRGTIEYTYDAAGKKLKKVVTEGTEVTTTLYLIGTYVNDTLQFLAQEEGRIRYRKQEDDFVYDYFLRDHLNNVRIVLTEEQQQDTYMAVTFEDATTADEQLYYENANVGRTARPGGFYSNGTNGDKVQLLRKSTQNIGSGKLLKVMAGDLLHAKVDYYTPNETTNNSNAQGQNALLAQLVSLLNGGGAPAILKGSGTSVTNGLSAQSAFISFMSPQTGSGGTIPKAYLNILFFDEQFTFVPENSESIPISVKGSGHTIFRVAGDAKEAKKNGYVYIYVSNESENLVFFDNLQVLHERGRILEENHYYAFGLTMAGISSKSAGKMATSFKFNAGTEFNNDLGIASYETYFRSYDAQIGRFHQVDPMVDKYVGWSPYSFAFNNPINWQDPLGADPDPGDLGGIIDHLLKNGGGSINPDGKGGWNYTMHEDAGGGGLIEAFDYMNKFDLWGLYGFAGSPEEAKNNYFNAGGLDPYGILGNWGSVVVYGRWDNGNWVTTNQSGVESQLRQQGGYWDGGGIPTSVWTSGLGLGFSMAELLRQGKVYQIYGTSAQNVEKALANGRFIHYNGRNYNQAFRGNQYISSQTVKSSISTAKFASNLGKGITALNLLTAGVQYYNSEGTGADKARLAGSIIITATAAIPVVGPFISIGLGIADSFGAFDGIYNYFND